LGLTGFVGVAVLAGAVSVAAQPSDGPMGRHGGPGGPGIVRYLGLNPDQQEQLKALREGQKPQLEALGKELGENHRQLQEALDAASPDAAAVGAIAIQGHALQLQMRKLRDDGNKAVRALLTKEQQVMFDALQALRCERGPMGPMGPMGGGPLAPPPGAEE
jgi:Spy/CpxP family protein refolding chaperone